MRSQIFVTLFTFTCMFLSASTLSANEYSEEKTEAPAVTGGIVFIPFLGKKVFWKGEWSDGEIYRVGDAVQYDGSSYYCTTSHTPTLTDYPPNPAFWDLMAAGGFSGSKGSQ